MFAGLAAVIYKPCRRASGAAVSAPVCVKRRHRVLEWPDHVLLLPAGTPDVDAAGKLLPTSVKGAPVALAVFDNEPQG